MLECHNQEFIYEPRGFSSVKEMNEAIIHNHNEIVASDDMVICLGDCMLNDDKEGINCIRRLNGNIMILGGNHDTDNRIAQYNQIRCDIVYMGLAWRLRHRGYTFYFSHYPTLTSNNDVDKPLKRRIINVCGHSHTQDKLADMDKGLIYHAELDAHDIKPVSLDTIIEDIIKYEEEH